MRRFILTGAPGAGKTAILRQLELDGFSVVEEAATDMIALAQARGTMEPWDGPLVSRCGGQAAKRSCSGTVASPWHNPGCSRVPGPTVKRAHPHQGKTDLCANDATTLYYRTFHSSWVDNVGGRL